MALIITHNAGFFSCCSVKLHYIVDYINANKALPLIVDSSQQFNMYKINKTNDITFDYFEHYDKLDTIEFDKVVSINYNHDHQYIDYSHLDFKYLTPLIKKYFSTSNDITNIINTLEQKYNLDYDNICVLFYRGNDKRSEINMCGYDEYIKYTTMIIDKHPGVKFLIQSDETGFIDTMTKTFPTTSFYFKDEIRHMNKCNNTVDRVFREQNYIFSKYYLGITIIMSKCKYIICGSGNCDIWIMLYRGNADNVYQYLHNKFLV